MKKNLFVLLTSALLGAPLPALASEKDEVEAAFATWRAALSSGKAENVVRLYDKDAILLATLARDPLMDQLARTTYFAALTANPKMVVTLEKQHMKLLDDDNAIMSGLYTFSFEKDGQSVTIPARFSFVYEKKDGQWLIIEHHSSKVP